MSFLSRASSNTIFPVYLLPTLPFRRRKPSTDSTESESSQDSHPSITVDESQLYLNGHGSYLRCGRCAADLCSTSAIVSRGFTGRWGRAYLVSGDSHLMTPLHGGQLLESACLPNTNIHKPVPRQLVTGAHTVSDVSCMACESILGWKYVAAEEDSQKYKVGKYILETKRISVAIQWEADGQAPDVPPSDLAKHCDQNVEFDSQDEDECEDLFAGIWTGASALKRRQARKFVKNAGR